MMSAINRPGKVGKITNLHVTFRDMVLLLLEVQSPARLA